MTLTLGSAGGSSVPNWQLLQTSTPSGVSIVTFSGLSGYSKYRILACNLTSAANNPVYALRLNADSTNKYQTLGITVGSAFSAGGAYAPTTEIAITATSGGALAGFITSDIDHALLLCPKLVNSTGQQQGYGVINQLALYQTTSVLSSITFFSVSAVNFSTGSIYLLGAN